MNKKTIIVVIAVVVVALIGYMSFGGSKKNQVPTPDTVTKEVTTEKTVTKEETDVLESVNSLLEKIDDMMRLHNLTIDRELTMIELKKEVNQLLNKIGKKEKYRIVE